MVSAGACAVIGIASVRIQLLDEAATRNFTLDNASETVLLGLSDLGGAEVMSQMEKIAAVARLELKDLTEKVVLHALSSIIAAPELIVAVLSDTDEGDALATQKPWMR